ncbi:uncharacterized protein LOC118115909 [Hippoglossus stenolepis]|uniref:uncharacterized protein LOC118115909 n=1 Tax=Hippoglossus stenolepis TaxID=195615 RepID=UPI00159C51E2|nr:uncharacterized protein LOC118115909 [Hippoglossus stenolepis]
MLLGTFLLFFSSVSTVKSQITNLLEYSTTITTTRKVTVPPVLVRAKPDYQVVAGRTVELYCDAYTIQRSIRWSWQHLESETWREVGHSKNLNLTEPNQSGPYRCRAENEYSQSMSNIITVYIIPMQPTENFGIAGFVLSLLALIVSLTVLCWLGWERLRGKLPPSNTAAKGFPAPEKAQKGGLPNNEGDGGVYMNYTSNNQDYSNLDPVNMTGDNMYSSLS